MEMLKMVYFTLLCSLFFFGLTTAGQESFSMVNLHEPKPILLQALSHTGVPIAVSVSNKDLNGISSSVLMAESWLRTHVLTYFPATQITTIVVANNVVCNKCHEEIWGLVLPSMKNIYYSLVRWGLEKEIKVSTSFSKDCFKNPFFDRFRDDLSENVIKPLLDFLKSSNSTYSVNPPPDFFPFSEKAIKLVASHTESMKKLGFFKGIKVNVLSSSPKGREPMKRKLISSMVSNVVDPFPARPTPLPEIPPSPLHHSIGYSVPAHVVRNPPPYLPPLFPQPAPSPSMSFSFPPESPPAPAFIPSNPPPSASIPANPPPPASIPSSPPSHNSIPSSPPSHNSIPSSPPPPDFLPSNPPEIFTYPPCTPPPTQTAPTPERGEEKGLWCVAKPTVPADTLQEAIDYACGEGGADCEEIKPNGSCYNPDTVVAHASYAFNSYWQKNKKSGGSCSFGETAMIINADPSFQQCKFILSLN